MKLIKTIYAEFLGFLTQKMEKELEKNNFKN